jgi:hypothetical protein
MKIENLQKAAEYSKALTSMNKIQTSLREKNNTTTVQFTNHSIFSFDIELNDRFCGLLEEIKNEYLIKVSELE